MPRGSDLNDRTFFDLHEIGGLELSPCAVADVEHLHLLLFLQNAVDHTIHMGFWP